MSNRKDLVIWHDAINNSISKHRSNNNRSLSTDQLKSLLLRYKENITAIVYCRRNGTDNIEKELKKTGILVLNIVEDFISKRKAKDQILIEKYKELHQPPSLELKTLLLLRRYSADLSTLGAKKKRNRLSPKNRRATHNRLKALKLQITPTYKLLMY